jgi:hypothetical protein
MILGCNLSSSSMSKASANNDNLLSMTSMIGVVVAKMIILPMIGIFTGYVLKNYLWDIPGDIEGSFYLVLMIVFLTPTANNVMVSESVEKTICFYSVTQTLAAGAGSASVEGLYTPTGEYIIDDTASHACALAGHGRVVGLGCQRGHCQSHRLAVRYCTNHIELDDDNRHWSG